MRGIRIVLLLSLLVVGGWACGDGRPESKDAEPIGTAVAASSPSSHAPTPTPVDVVPKPVNAAGFPPCGFFITSIKDPSTGRDFPLLELGVAVRPEASNLSSGPSSNEIKVTYDFADPDGKAFHHVVGFDRTGKVLNGTEVTPLGASVPYISMELSLVMPLDATDRKWIRPTTIRVTVDSTNSVAETNEANNTLTLQLTPPRGSGFKIADSTCTVQG